MGVIGREVSRGRGRRKIRSSFSTYILSYCIIQEGVFFQSHRMLGIGKVGKVPMASLMAE